MTDSRLAAPLDSTINYPGSPSENGQPANGTYDLRLTLFETVEGSDPFNVSFDLAVEPRLGCDLAGGRH
jgi:hypothetical protein